MRSRTWSSRRGAAGAVSRNAAGVVAFVSMASSMARPPVVLKQVMRHGGRIYSPLGVAEFKLGPLHQSPSIGCVWLVPFSFHHWLFEIRLFLNGVTAIGFGLLGSFGHQSAVNINHRS